jgi:hypothetical protein
VSHDIGDDFIQRDSQPPGDVLRQPFGGTERVQGVCDVADRSAADGDMRVTPGWHG